MTALPILLVEDNPTARFVTQHHLAQRGCQVSLATNAKEALGYLNSQSFSIILMDIGLPDGDGLEISQAIRDDENCPNQKTPIIIVTAHSAADIPTQTRQALNIDHVFTKPLNPTHFDKIIQYVNASSP